jgi:hypothetical protein
MVGAVLILIAMFVVGPIAVFAMGAVWSALHGYLEVEAADARAAAETAGS